MIWVIIIFIIAGFVTVAAGTYLTEPFIITLGGILFGMAIFLTLFYPLFDTPTAMDVYQGKTTLEITYKDGVAIDSVVVYKGKEE